MPDRVASARNAQRPIWAGGKCLPTAFRPQPFHSTAPAASPGFTNFKNSPRLDWKTQKKLDKKNAEINANLSPYVAYSEALKAHRPKAWIGARKKVVWSRLFGEGNSSKSAEQNTGGERD